MTLIEIVGAVIGVAFLVMSMMIKSAKSGKKAAEIERDQAKTKAESMKRVIESHEKRLQIEDDMAGNGTSPDRLQNDPYNRD